MNLSNIFDDLEKLKKEVWYLIKKVLPKLEELISSSGSAQLTEIKQQLNSQLEQIETLQSQMQTTSDMASAANSSVQSLNSTLSTMQQDLSSVEGEIDDIDQSLITISQAVDQNSGSVLQLSNSLTTISANAAQALNTANSLSDDVVLISNQAAQSATKINGLEDDVEQLEGLVQSQTQTISSLSQSVGNLSTTLQSLEGQIASAKLEQSEVIYDMYSTDSAINRGFTSGMGGTKFFTFDFSPYHTIRIYARLYSSNCVQEVRVHNRKLSDITLFAAGANPVVLCVMKIMFAVEPLLNRFQVGAYARYTYAAATGAFTGVTGTSDANFFVYRIEGIKK